MEGWVDLGYPVVHRPGVELATSITSRTPYHYTTLLLLCWTCVSIWLITESLPAVHVNCQVPGPWSAGWDANSLNTEVGLRVAYARSDNFTDVVSWTNGMMRWKRGRRRCKLWQTLKPLSIQSQCFVSYMMISCDSGLTWILFNSVLSVNSALVWGHLFVNWLQTSNETAVELIRLLSINF